jgi:uncharacterized membrane protein YphA (DoxX/SURF4 family)
MWMLSGCASRIAAAIAAVVGILIMFMLASAFPSLVTNDFEIVAGGLIIGAVGLLVVWGLGRWVNRLNQPPWPGEP